MYLNHWFRALLLGTTLCGCAALPAQKEESAGEKTEILLGIFQGKLPCADCPGINTVLTLTQEGKYIDIGHFTLKETYLERSVKPLETRGEWTVIKGTAQNDDAVVYELSPEGSKQPRYFLKVDGTEVKMLNRNGNEIDSRENFTLHKIK